MQDIVYVGGANVRSLSEDDFSKMGIEHKGIDFQKGVAVEVSNELATVLLESVYVRREFAEAGDTNTFPTSPDTPMPAGLVEGSTTTVIADPTRTPGLAPVELPDDQSSVDKDATAKASKAKAKSSSS
jgi:hypothetical protein